ncbi:MAG: Eco57I restriction-modification methylase domain-containing protein, partial [Dolichospermum sp.]
VDIDQQAVETTKLSLLLKVLEGESGETITRQLQLFKERALPDLDYNIQCGNTLIDGEFYQHTQLNFLDENTAYRVNIFDWKSAFSAIMKRGGFDVVIGNP